MSLGFLFCYNPHNNVETRGMIASIGGDGANTSVSPRNIASVSQSTSRMINTTTPIDSHIDV